MNNFQNILDYIEDNLKTKIEITELAEMSHYSLFHFYKLFQAITGLPIKQYIIRRRLIHALYVIQKGSEITAVALDYGFDSYSGFFRAFSKEYGLSPSNYLKKNKAMKPYKINMDKERYKFMNQNQLKKLLANWNLTIDTVQAAIYPNTGNISEFVWDVNDDYLLKAFESKENLNKNRTIIPSLPQDFTIVKTAKGHDYLEFGNQYYLLMTKSKGNPWLSKNILSSSDYSGRFYGELIGQTSLMLKGITGDFPKTNLVETLSNWAFPVASPLLEWNSEEKLTYLDRLIERHPLLAKQLIHRDLNSSNILLVEDSFTLIDFDLAEINVRIFDPCYFTTSILADQFSQENFSDEKWFTLFHDVMKGYDEIATLSAVEKEAIPLVVIAIQLICVAYFTGYDKYFELAETNIAMTNWLLANLEKLQLIG